MINTVKKLCLLFLLLSLYQEALAAIPSGYKDVDFSKLPRAIKIEPSLTGKDIANLIPYNKLEEEDTGSEVQAKVFDQGVNSFLKSDMVQKSSLGQTAKTIESSLQTEIELPKTRSDEVNHRFSFQYQAFQREAKIRYRGYFDFDVKYNTSSSEFLAEISQDIGGKTLVLGQENTRIEDKLDHISRVSMRWNW